MTNHIQGSNTQLTIHIQHTARTHTHTLGRVVSTRDTHTPTAICPRTHYLSSQFLQEPVRLVSDSQVLHSPWLNFSGLYFFWDFESCLSSYSPYWPAPLWRLCPQTQQTPPALPYYCSGRTESRILSKQPWLWGSPLWSSHTLAHWGILGGGLTRTVCGCVWVCVCVCGGGGGGGGEGG